MSHLAPECRCPKCGYRMDRATSADENTEPPVPGDISICLRCANIAEFAEDLTVKEMDPMKLLEVLGDPVIHETVKRIKAMHPKPPRR